MISLVQGLSFCHLYCMKKLMSELRKRGIIRIAGLYIALTWLIMQISDVVFPAFGIPDSALRYVLIVAAAGLPLVLIFSWFFEITSEGILTEAEFQESGVDRPDRSHLTIFTLAALVMILAVSLYMNFRQASDTDCRY